MKKILTIFTALILFGSMTVVQATDYYYRGNQNGWGATLMTTSNDGYYAYISAKSNADNGNEDNIFKISLTTGGWDYGCSIASPGFNGTDITEMNNSSNTSSYSNGDWNNVVHSTVDFYILVYYPNTAINTTSNPIICASTTLPDDSSIPATPDTYTVVGTVPGLDWDETSSTNDMTINESVYTLTLTDVELSTAAPYEYKIVRNHSWAVAYPQEGNASFSVIRDGIYDIVFTLDLAATPEYSIDTTFKSAAVVIPAVKMHGTFADGSTWGDTPDFTIASTNESASLKIENLSAGNYYFKVVVGSSYLGNGYTFHRDYTGATGIGTGGDMKLEADVEGDYTFTWTYEGNALNIGFPECDYYIRNKWYGCDWKWKGMTPADGTYRVENMVYGGDGVDYKAKDATESTWKAQSVLFYMEGGQKKGVTAYDTVDFVLDPIHDTIWAENVKKDVTVYTVAGDELALFSQGWAPSHPYKYTEMKKQADGSYKWTNMDENATLCEGPIEFKVIKDKDYGKGNWPEGDGNNFVFNIQRSGEYEIAINFDPCSKAIWVDTTFVKAIGIHDFTIKGFGDWGTGHDFIRNEYNDKALVTLSLTASATPYEFKLVDAYDKWYGDGQTFTRENPSVRDIVAPEGEGEHPNMTIKADRTGDYLFTYIFETEQLVVSYPAIVPETKIAPLSGRFTINAQKDSVRFSRGNLQYNFGENAWYAAEKQYEALSDLNLRFGDNTYQGSVDLFDWSCTSSNYGLLASNVNADYTGEFVDWGQKFAGDEKWSTLSKDEWNYLLYSRKQGDKYLWTILGVIVAPDTINGFVLFPDDWTAPSGVTIHHYGFYNLDDEEKLKENAFTLAQWEQMEEAGAVFLPLAGARAGWWGNKVGIDGATLVDEPMNPLADSTYCWVDNVDWMGFYWSSTIEDDVNVKTPVLPGWHNGNWTAPQYWGRARRYGQSVRLVTRTEYVDVRTGLNAGHYYTVCWNKTMSAIKGASLWSFIGKDVNFAYIQEESAPYPAGKPYIVYAESEKLEAIQTGDAVDETALVANNGLHGTFSALGQADLDGKKAAAGDHDVYLVIGDELRRATGYALDGITPLVGNSLPAFRAYVVLDEITGGTPNQAPGKKVRSMPLHKDATQGFENLEGGEKPIKVLVDGQLYILRGENVYNANGQIVQ